MPGCTIPTLVPVRGITTVDIMFVGIMWCDLVWVSCSYLCCIGIGQIFPAGEWTSFVMARLSMIQCS